MLNGTPLPTIPCVLFADSALLLGLPFFTFWPDALTRTTVGEIVRLWCGGRGIPPPTVTWWRRLDNDTVVEVISDRHIVIYDEGLVFAPVQKDDEGVYYCNISSPLQTRISNDAMLRVFGELAPSIIFISRKETIMIIHY